MSSDVRTTQQIPLDQIVPSPFQTRKDFDPEQLQGLAKTMQQHGLMNPICVRRRGDTETRGHGATAKDGSGVSPHHRVPASPRPVFELIAGERRTRAAKLLGWKTIEARVDVVDDKEAAQRVVVENLQRDDLNPIEQAEGYKRLEELDLSQDDIAERVGVSQAVIARYLALLDLPSEVQEIIPRGIISEHHARFLRRITNKRDMISLALQGDRHAWSVKEMERRVNTLMLKKGKTTAQKTSLPPRLEFTFKRDGEGVWIRAYWSEKKEKLDPYIDRLKAAVQLWITEQLSRKIARQEAGTDEMTDADYARKIALDNDPDVAAAYFARENRKREKARR